MNGVYVGYAAAGALGLAVAVTSARVRRLPVTVPLLSLTLGVLLGPRLLGVMQVPESGRDRLLLEVARAALTVSLMGVALRFPVHGLRPVLRPVLLLIVVVMPLAAVVTGLLGVALLGLPVALAALLGACLSPTDPVLASGVVSGAPAEQDLPGSVRAVLTEESGANDGLALPLVLVALAPVLGEAAGDKLLTALYQLGVGAAVAGELGAATGLAVRAARRRDATEQPSELVLTLLLAFAVLGIGRLLHSDAVLGVFVAGLAYAAVVGEREREREDTLDEVANRYLVVPFFLLLGTVLPWGGWADLGWGAVPFVVAVLLLRRPPVVLLLSRPLGLKTIDAAFCGWFGPMGVSAVFYLVLSADEGVDDPRLFAAGTLVVAASTLVHGVTALPGRRLYAAHASPSAGPDITATTERQ